MRSCRRVESGNGAARTRCDSKTSPVMWHLQFHVSEGSQLMCPICVSATGAFGAHGLKNHLIQAAKWIWNKGRGCVAGKKPRVYVLAEAHHMIVNHAICEHMIYFANDKNDSFHLFYDEFVTLASSFDLTCKRGSVRQSEGLSIPRSSVRFRLKPDTSNSHEFELHRPSNKGTKLLLKVIKAIFIIL